jgi:endonuclease/exonuclease/phosphatase family metal-dependent hydrolase
MLVTRCADAMPTPSVEARQAIAEAAADGAEHGRLAREIEALNVLEDRRLHDPVTPSPLSVAFWNIERCKHVEAAARLLADVGATVNLLCEMDLGMARSAQRHTTREVADRLGHGYVFGVEFVELGLGAPRERALHLGEENDAGLHGAAIVSACALERPTLIRLELDGGWFDGSRGERRIGGRMALAGTVRVNGHALVVASVHMESHGDPRSRAGQMRALLESIEAYAPGAAAVIGGDFNTQSAARAQTRDAGSLAALLAEDGGRLLDPERYEPLFEVAREHGYEWAACNVPRAPTTRRLPHHPPDSRAQKLDWFFCRGVRASAPRVVSAVDAASGLDLSDHELLALTVEPE